MTTTNVDDKIKDDIEKQWQTMAATNNDNTKQWTTNNDKQNGTKWTINNDNGQ